MQTTGEHDYWQNAKATDEPVAAPPSQFAGYDMQEAGDEDHEETLHTDFAPLSWEASEYVHREKTFFWFATLGLVTLGVAAVAYFLVQSWTFTLLVFVMSGAIGVYGHRPPKSLHYTLDYDHIRIEDKEYAYGDFKSFAVLQDGPLAYVMILPVKRFSPALTLYFPPENGEQIINLLGSVLPLEQRELDLVERAVRKLRF